jgi:hypothetical protein
MAMESDVLSGQEYMITLLEFRLSTVLIGILALSLLDSILCTSEVGLETANKGICENQEPRTGACKGDDHCSEGYKSSTSLDAVVASKFCSD